MLYVMLKMGIEMLYLGTYAFPCLGENEVRYDRPLHFVASNLHKF